MGGVTVSKVGAGETARCMTAGRVVSIRGSIMEMRFDARQVSGMSLTPSHGLARGWPRHPDS